MSRIVLKKVKKPKVKKMVSLVEPKDGKPDQQSVVTGSDWKLANADWKANAPKEFANLLEAKKA
jgi:hypothetical protein